MTWKSFKSITTRLEDSTTIMRLQTTVLYSTLTSISWSIVCIKRLPANTRAKYPRLPANINKMVYSLYNIRAVREERSNRHFTTKVSQEEKTEVGENIDNSTVVYHANRTSLIDRLKAEKCEICEVTGKLDMHHVRKLKALDGKGYADKLMIARRGKTIALC